MSFGFAVVGSMTDAGEAQRLADKYAAGVEPREMLSSANAFWSRLTRNARFESAGSASVTAFNTIFPWLAHDAMVHLTAPHGLEQYSGGAWGTRDVCQGPIELLLALEHDEAAKDVLRMRLRRQQHARDGDWPQWFMLEPYSFDPGPPTPMATSSSGR